MDGNRRACREDELSDAALWTPTTIGVTGPMAYTTSPSSRMGVPKSGQP